MTRRVRLAGAIALAVAAFAAEPAAAAQNLSFPIELGPVGTGELLVEDLDDDGALDVAHAGDPLTTWYGDGAGGFTEESHDLELGLYFTLTSGDFDEDGFGDLLTTQILTSPMPTTNVFKLLSDGTGGLGAAISIPGAATMLNLATGDFDGDGNTDVAGPTMAGGPIRVLLGDGAGGFDAGADYATAKPAGGIAVADLDGNGRDDLIVTEPDGVAVLRARTGPLATRPSGGLDLFLTEVLAAADDVRQLTLGDFDADGKLDVAATAHHGLYLFYGDGLGGLAAGQAVPVGFFGTVSMVATGDFGGDAGDDLAVVGDGSDLPEETPAVVSLILGRADRQPVSAGVYDSGLDGGGTAFLATSDLDEDGEGDVVVSGSGGTNILYGDPIRMTPALTLFEDTRVDAISPLYTVTASNRDDTSHAIGGVALDGLDADQFTIAADACTGQTLAPGATCAIQLRFTPDAPVDALTALIVDSDAASPHVALLAGSAFEDPSLDVTPSSLSFGPVTPGAVSAEQTVTATNDGDIELVISGGGIVGSNEFEVTDDDCHPVVLEPGDSCSVTVRFRPGDFGPATGSLRFEGTAANTPINVALSGSTPPLPPNGGLSVMPAELDFGRVKLGAGVSRDVVLRNGTGGILTLGELFVEPYFGGFSARQAGCLGFGLVAGSSCRVTVRFTPSHKGAHQANVFFRLPGGSQVGRFTVKGTGFEPPKPPPVQDKKPLSERVKAGIAAWRDRGVEGLVKRGLRLTRVDVVLPGSATLELSARRAGKRIVVAKGGHRYKAAGKADIVVKPTKRGRALLRGTNQMKLSVRLRFRSKAGKVTAVTTTFVLRRLTRRASFAACSASPARNRPSVSPRPRSACSPSA